MLKVAVIGSGISGMTAALNLTKLGAQVEVFDKEPEIGGRMGVKRIDSTVYCIGGKNIGHSYSNFRKLCADLNAGAFEEFGLNSGSAKQKGGRQINNKKPLASVINVLKMSKLSDITTAAPIIFSILKDRSNSTFSGKFFLTNSKKKSYNKPLSDIFSESFIENVVRPLVVRNNASEPEEVPIANFVTNLAMIFDSYDQLQNGPEQFFTNFCNRVNVRKSCSVQRVSTSQSGKYLVATADSQEVFDAVIVATPANAAAELIKELDGKLSDQLKQIRYFPVGVVIAEYKNAVFSENIRALTFPRESALNNAGAYGTSKLNVVRYTFSGKASRPLLNTNPSIDDLLKLAEAEARSVLNIEKNELLAHTGVVLPTGLCAYSFEHGNTLGEIDLRLQTLPGLFLCGDYIEGVSIEACCLSGVKAANKISEYLKCSDTSLQGTSSAMY